jgi:hypothetical protein
MRLDAGLKLVDEIAGAAALRRYVSLPAMTGDFLFWIGRVAEARSGFESAVTLIRNERERAFLLACGGVRGAGRISSSGGIFSSEAFRPLPELHRQVRFR